MRAVGPPEAAFAPGRPLIGPAGVGGCNQPQSRQSVTVLFALGNENRSRWVGRQQVTQPIYNPTRITEFPNPATVAVRPALPKILRLIPHDLIEQFALLIVVGVGRHLAALV